MNRRNFLKFIGALVMAGVVVPSDNGLYVAAYDGMRQTLPPKRICDLPDWSWCGRDLTFRPTWVAGVDVPVAELVGGDRVVIADKSGRTLLSLDVKGGRSLQRLHDGDTFAISVPLKIVG